MRETNAIILAAGLGTRLRPVTDALPKSLVEVGGKPIIVRTIESLIKHGITDITVVGGFLCYMVEDLEEQFDPYVRVLYNEHYMEYNNMWSMYTAIEFFDDTYVIDGDLLILDDSVFEETPHKSMYFTTRRYSNTVEWFPKLLGDKVIDMDIKADTEGYSMSGITYWSSEDCKKIKDEFHKYNNLTFLENSSFYWDNIPVSIIKDLDVGTFEVKDHTLVEIDTVEDLMRIREEFEYGKENE